MDFWVRTIGCHTHQCKPDLHCGPLPRVVNARDAYRRPIQSFVSSPFWDDTDIYLIIRVTRDKTAPSVASQVNLVIKSPLLSWHWTQDAMHQAKRRCTLYICTRLDHLDPTSTICGLLVHSHDRIMFFLSFRCLPWRDPISSTASVVTHFHVDGPFVGVALLLFWARSLKILNAILWC